MQSLFKTFIDFSKIFIIKFFKHTENFKEFDY